MAEISLVFRRSFQDISCDVKVVSKMRALQTAPDMAFDLLQLLLCKSRFELMTAGACTWARSE